MAATQMTKTARRLQWRNFNEKIIQSKTKLKLGINNWVNNNKHENEGKSGELVGCVCEWGRKASRGVSSIIECVWVWECWEIGERKRAWFSTLSHSHPYPSLSLCWPTSNKISSLFLCIGSRLAAIWMKEVKVGSKREIGSLPNLWI
jgi:hypothetical protein